MKSILKGNGKLNAATLASQLGISRATVCNRLRNNMPVLSADYLPKEQKAEVDAKIGHFLRNSRDAHLFDSNGYFTGIFSTRQVKEKLRTPVALPKADSVGDLKSQMINTLQDQMLDIISNINSVDTLLELLQVAKNVTNVKEVA